MPIQITAAQWTAMLDLLAQGDVFHSWACRQYFARARWEAGPQTLDIAQEPAPGVMAGTIRHNSTECANSTFGSARRSNRLLGALGGLDPVFGYAGELKVLSIGPRTCMELLHLMALGFRPENISALDLISSDPWITTGDMHKMPYPAKHFDVVISSWVLNYSSTPQLAVDEMLRVCKSNALLAIGTTYAPKSQQPDPTIIGSMQRSAQDLADLVGDSLLETHFLSSAHDAEKKAPVMLIARVR